MTTILRLISGSCAALLLGGCNSGSSDSLGTSGDVHLTKGTSTSLDTSVDVQDANGASTDDFASGQQINFVLTVQNNSSSPQTFNIQTCFGESNFLVISKSNSAVVLDSEATLPHCDALVLGGTPETLQPGKSLQFTYIWNQMAGTQLAAPGSYSVIGGVTCVNSPECMPGSPGGPDTSQLTATPYRSDPMSFTIKP